MTPNDFASAVLSPHGVSSMARRRVSEADVRAVLAAPEQVLAVRAGRVVLQSRKTLEDGRVQLLRVFVDNDRVPPEVVTAYRSSKIAKYWRQP